MTVTIANLTAQWSNSSIDYTGLSLNVSSNGHSTNSNVFSLKVNNSIILAVDPTGNLKVNASITANGVNANTIVGNTVQSQTIVIDSKGNLRDIPLNNQTVGYVLNANDIGKVVSTNTTIYLVNSVFFSGNAVSVYNNSASSITITQNTNVTMYLGGTATTGNRTLAQRGVATILCVAANTFVASGAGLS